MFDDRRKDQGGEKTLVELEPDECWCVVYPCGGYDYGHELMDAAVVYGKLGVVFASGDSVPVVRMKIEDAKSFADRMKRIAADDDEDLRTLAVLYDSQGERYRRFDDSVTLCTEAAFSDWPLTGDRNVLYRLKNMAKKALTPVTQHSKWLESSRIGKGDRSRYEHESLSKILASAVDYDQLNVSNCLFAERIVRRQMVLERGLPRR